MKFRYCLQRSQKSRVLREARPQNDWGKPVGWVWQAVWSSVVPNCLSYFGLWYTYIDANTAVTVMQTRPKFGVFSLNSLRMAFSAEVIRKGNESGRTSGEEVRGRNRME